MSLNENKDDWGVQFAVPEVVFMETVNVVRRQWNARRNELANVRIGEFGLGNMLESLLAESIGALAITSCGCAITS
ncbi:hypothetical protein [Nocardia pneumoniae]|uniref:hypothetical protein n=1 Tax=Nocardia pneumoniae TaxID=228601 RepID=UPI00031762F7|nr:hypothetical protein [Nocardia pneumoniae]